MMKTLACVLLFSTLVNALTVNYSGNVTLSDQGQFQFRETSLTGISIGVYTGAYYQSLSVGAGAGAATASGLFSSFYGGLLLPPTQYTTYFENSVNFSKGSNAVTASVDGASAFIATTYLSLQEVNAAGSVIQSIGLIDNGGANSWDWTGSTNTGNGGLRTSTYNGIRGTLSVNFTVVYSDVVGVLDVVGSPVITPLSTETIVEIGGYTYADPANKLRLTMAVGSGESTQSTSLTGSTQLTSGAGSAGATFTAGTVVSADGAQSNVQVVVAAGSLSDLSNQILAGQLLAGIKGSASVKLVSVDFPAGAKHITWDPSQGAGSEAPANNGGILAVSMLSLAAFVFASLL